MKKTLAAVLFGIVCLVAGGSAAVFWRTAGGENLQKADDSASGIYSLTLHDLQQKPVNLAALAADREYLLVNFWATWCPPCLHEMPLLEKTAAAASRVKVVGISYETNDVVAGFIAENPVKYDIFTTSDDIFDFFHENGNPSGSMPFTLLLTPDGEIVRNKIGDFKTSAQLKSFISGKDLL